MEQYTIRGFRDVLEESVEYLALTNTEEKLECLDKCNWILSFIILTVKSRDKPLNYPRVARFQVCINLSNI